MSRALLIAVLVGCLPIAAAHAATRLGRGDRARVDTLWSEETRSHAAPVLRVTLEPGYVPAFYALTTVPEITLYRNGLLVLAATPAGGRWAQLRITALPESAVADIGNRLTAIGIDHDLTFAENQALLGKTTVVDVPFLLLEVYGLAGVSAIVPIAAPPLGPPFDDPLTAAQSDARTALNQLIADLQAPARAFGTQLHRKQPDAYSADVVVETVPPVDARTWPATLPAPRLPRGNKRAACVTIRGADLRLLEKITRGRPADRPWSFSGGTYRVAIRPLFPAQASCRVHDGSF